MTTIAIDARLVYYRRESGIGQYILHLAHWLPRLDPARAYTIFHSRKDRVDLAGAANARRVNLWTPSHHRFEQLALPIELARARFDLLHSPDFIPPFRGRYRRVITVHDLTFLRYPQFLTAASYRYYNAQVARAVQRADHILADSHATKADLIDLLDVPAEKITVVWLAADPRFKPQPLHTARPRLDRLGLPDRYLLFVGTFEPRKNVAGLLAAYRRLADRDRLLPPLVIAGRRGWLFDETLAQIERLGLRERILFLDSPPDDDLVAVYNGAAALVLPSHYEGFGLPVLEAMSCGAPVVISNRGSLPEIAGGAALVVDDPDDADALAAAIAQVLAAPDLRIQLRQLGLARAAEFTWERCARETLAVYARMLLET
ncbi:MAG TPA: glycosyltransferase family 1 protein [Anaerolineae bacterium]|nr:glycosyltransferase family 1 protein [Anaerolineae bacterium]